MYCYVLYCNNYHDALPGIMIMGHIGPHIGPPYDHSASYQSCLPLFTAVLARGSALRLYFEAMVTSDASYMVVLATAASQRSCRSVFSKIGGRSGATFSIFCSFIVL